MELSKFLDSIKIAATSPYALVAYLALVGAWVYIVAAGRRLRTITLSLKVLPDKDRLGILKKEYNTTPRAGLSAEEWITARKHLLFFYGFVATLLAAVVLILAAILQPPTKISEIIPPLNTPLIAKTASDTGGPSLLNNATARPALRTNATPVLEVRPGTYGTSLTNDATVRRALVTNSTPLPAEIIAEINNRPPFQRDETAAHYIGQCFRWLVTFKEVSRSGPDQVYFIFFDRGNNAALACDIRVSDFPWIRTTKGGYELYLIGTISTIRGPVITLTNATLERIDGA